MATSLTSKTVAHPGPLPASGARGADSLRTLVTFPPPLAAIRMRASASGSLTTFMCQPLACRSVSRVAHDPDMALPEHEIAALERRARIVDGDGLAERGLLHVAVARRGHAGGGERRLDEARAVDPLRRPAAPEIRRLEKALGDRDIIRFARAGLREMTEREVQPVSRDREIALMGHNRQPRPERQRHARRQLDAGAGIGVGAERCDPMRRLRRRPERRGRHVADVTVAIELNPRPSAVLVVDHHALAVERFGFQGSACVGVAPERRACRDNSLRLPDCVSRARRRDRADDPPRGRGGQGSTDGRTGRQSWGSGHRFGATVAVAG